MGSDKNEVSGKDFMKGAFIGGVVGAVTALMLAPKAGKELRSDIGEQSIALKKKSGDFAQKAKVKSSDLAKTMSQQSTQVVGKVKEWPASIRRTGNNEDAMEIETLRVDDTENKPNENDGEDAESTKVEETK